MKAIKFKQSDIEIAKDQDQYITLPAHIGRDGVVTSCWSLSRKERVKVLLSGRLFLQVYAFGSPLQPLKMSIDNPLEE